MGYRNIPFSVYTCVHVKFTLSIDRNRCFAFGVNFPSADSRLTPINNYTGRRFYIDVSVYGKTSRSGSALKIDSFSLRPYLNRMVSTSSISNP